jgi:Lysozyme like domain
VFINAKNRIFCLVFAVLTCIANTAYALPATVVKPVAHKVAVDPITALLKAKTLTKAQLLYLLKYVGFKGQALRVAYGVAMKESQGNPGTHNLNPRTGDDSYGLFQINLYGALKYRVSYYCLKSRNALKNPLVNAEIAYSMSGHGKDFSPWHVNYYNWYRTDNYAVNAFLKTV